MTEVFNREKYLEKVRALIAKANDPAVTDEERDAFLLGADRLMTKFTIEMWELEFAKPVGEREKPIWRHYDRGDRGMDWNYRQATANLFGALARLCRCKVGDWGTEIRVIGYESDLRYLDMLYTSVLLYMAENLNPMPRPSRSWQENLAMLRWSGGKTWEDCHRILSQASLPDYPYTGQRWERRIGVRFTKEFKETAERLGRERGIMASRPERWRESYIEGFVYGVIARIKEMQGEQEAMTGLVLAGREEELLEEMYQEYPEMRPHPEGCDCDIHHHCSDPKCQRPNCRGARIPVRYYRASKYVDKTDFTAMAHGREVGKKVNLNRGDLGHTKKEVE